MDEDEMLILTTQKQICDAVGGYCFISWAPYSKRYYIKWSGYRNGSLHPLDYTAFIPKDEFNNETADKVIFDIQTFLKGEYHVGCLCSGNE